MGFNPVGGRSQVVFPRAQELPAPPCPGPPAPKAAPAESPWSLWPCSSAPKPHPTGMAALRWWRVLVGGHQWDRSQHTSAAQAWGGCMQRLGAQPLQPCSGTGPGTWWGWWWEGASDPPRGPGLPLPGEGGTRLVLGQRQDQTAEAGGTSGLHRVQPPELVAQDHVQVVLSASKDGDSTTSLGNLGQGCATLPVKSVSCCAEGPSCVPACAHGLWSWHWAPRGRAWLRPLGHPPCRYG